jgi:hypothetical protein
VRVKRFVSGVKMSDKKHEEDSFVKELWRSTLERYDLYMSQKKSITPENKAECETTFTKYCQKIPSKKFKEDLFKKCSSTEAAIKLAGRYLENDLNQALKISNSKTRSGLCRYLKDVLKRNAENKIDFKYYDVPQAMMLDNSARVYGDIKWGDYKARGIYQGLWVQHIDAIKKFEQYEVREVSEKKQPYSSEQLIEGTKRLHIICGQYLSPEHIMKGLEHWMHLNEHVFSIQDKDFPELEERSSTGNDFSNSCSDFEVARFFSKFIEILLSMKDKERVCFFEVVRLDLEDCKTLYTEAKKNLNLKSSQDVKNNYERACDKIKNSLSKQDDRLVFSKSVNYFFENIEFRTLVDNELEKRRTK